MKVEIRSDHCRISGYVNAVERWSSPIAEHGTGRHFLERIRAGAFQAALQKNGNVKLMHNHQRVLDEQKNGAFTLNEDAIGLRFEGDVYDAEILERARNKELVGWSFGFSYGEKKDEPDTEGTADFKRTVRSLALDEVSIIDKRMQPCYSATSLEVRGGVDEGTLQLRATAQEVEYVETPAQAAQEDGADFAAGGDTSHAKDGKAEDGKDYKAAVRSKRLALLSKG